MKPILMASALFCCGIFFLHCTKRVEGDSRPSALEEKILGKWKLSNSPFAGYWEFKSAIVDSLCTRRKTVRELEIHIPGLCNGKGYWSLTNDSILDNSCIPMAKLIKLTNDSLTFRFSSGYFAFDYVWKR
jgi:hypothetical protein